MFKVPDADTKSTDSTCTVLVSENGQTDSTKQFTYSFASTPSITSVSPLRGGTGGGTLLTITGTKFP